MRSSGLAVVLVAAGGCDLVYGVEGDAGPCGDASFASATPTDLAIADLSSVSWAGDRMVFARDGMVFEQALPGGEPAPIDLSLYPPASLALAPEGDALFFTADVESPLLQAAVRDRSSWLPDGVVPAGAVAGTPSAAEFGPRRVLVRLRALQPEVQEYEADANQWRPVGEVHRIPGTFGPNLTPSGLDVVYDDAFASEPAAYIAHRSSTDRWFGDAVAILPGAHASPQLLGRCRTLFVTDRLGESVARRYDLSGDHGASM